MRLIRTVLIAAATAASLSAQQSLFQDAKGDTSIYLGDERGVAAVNFGASKISAGWTRNLNRIDSWRFGFEITGTAQSGVASVVKNGAAQTGMGGDINFIWLPFHPTPPAAPGTSAIPCSYCGHWVVFDFGYLRSSLDTVSGAQPLQAPQNHNFDSYTGRVAFNTLIKTESSDFLLGLVAGVSRQNNTDELKTVQVSTDVIQLLQNNQELTLVQNSKAAYLGNYVKYIGVPINADLIWYPWTNKLTPSTPGNPQPNSTKVRFGFDLFERANVGELSAYRYIAPGIGAFITKPGEPAHPIGGVTVSYKSGKAQVALVTGWIF